MIRLFSPFWMLVTEPGSGLSTGLLPPGTDVSQIPLSLTTAEGFAPQAVRLNELVAGTYTIYLLPKRDGGPFRVTADGLVNGAPLFSDSRSGVSAGCEWYYLLLHVDLDEDGLMSFGELQGPFLLSSVPALVGRAVDSPCPPPSRQTAQVGGVQTTATAESGSPTPPPATPAPPTTVPETQPTSEPTSAPPTSVPPTSVPPTQGPPTEIPIEVQTPVPPTEAPPQPTSRPHPDIEIDHSEEESAAPGGSPALPLVLTMVPGLFLGVMGLARRKGGGR